MSDPSDFEFEDEEAEEQHPVGSDEEELSSDDESGMSCLFSPGMNCPERQVVLQAMHNVFSL